MTNLTVRLPVIGNLVGNIYSVPQILTTLVFTLIRIVSTIPIAVHTNHQHRRRHRYDRRDVNQVFAASQANADDIEDGIGSGTDTYKLFTGNGSPAEGWPPISQWVSFDSMFNSNKNLMRQSCPNDLIAPVTTDEEIGQIWNAVQSAAYRSGVDHRFILAVMMQESHGCVRVRTTINAVSNPGLMQDHDGPSTCNLGGGKYLTPCPDGQIYGMIDDGVQGTTSGDGLAGILDEMHAQYACDDVATTYYRAARKYNSGSINVANLDDGMASTNCYASDIANRLTGWVWAPHACSL